MRLAARRTRAAGAVLLALLASACRREADSPVRGPLPPSILLVTLDTTRADQLGAYGGGRGATPHLDELAARGVVFEHAYAVAPMTLPAHATMLTGRLPTATGVRWNGEQRLADSPASLPTLAEQLRAAGYATGAFVSAAVLDHAFGLDRGFEIYDDYVSANPQTAQGSQGPPGPESPGKAERPARRTVELALAWLADQAPARPVFLWVHLFEAHDPYRPPEPFAARFPEDPYLGEIATADAALGELLSVPRWRAEAGAIVSVIGDHGESLGEHGEATHGILLHEAVLHVPWIVAAPGLAARRIAAPVSQADLAPTLLGLAAAEPLADSKARDGDDLSPALRGLSDGGRARTIYAESLYAGALYGWSPLRSTRRGSYKWIAGVRGELYDYLADPREAHELSSAQPAEAGALDRALGEIRAREATSSGSAALQGPVDATLAAQLQSLGYLTGGSAAGTGEGALTDSTVDPRDRIGIHERLRAVDAQWRRGDVAAAERALDELFAADPGNRLLRDVVERQLRGAIAQLAGNDAPTAAALRIRLAQLVALGGRRAEAQVLLEASTEPPAEPESRALANLGLATLALGDRRYAEAVERARTAAELAPASAAARNTLALALDALGRTTEAESAYRAALALDPALHATELNLARLLAADPARHAEAAEHLRRFLARAPADDPRAAEARAALAHLSAEGGGGG